MTEQRWPDVDDPPDLPSDAPFWPGSEEKDAPVGWADSLADPVEDIKSFMARAYKERPFKFKVGIDTSALHEALERTRKRVEGFSGSGHLISWSYIEPDPDPADIDMDTTPTRILPNGRAMPIVKQGTGPRFDPFERRNRVHKSTGRVRTSARR